MNFRIEEESIVRLILEFLSSRGSYEALSSLMMESGITEEEYLDEACKTDVLYIQKLILQGRLDDVLSYFEPIGQPYPLIFKEIQKIILRQKFLETMSWQGGGGEKLAYPPFKPQKLDNSLESDAVDIEFILNQLKILKEKFDEEEFYSLSQCLNIESLDQHEDKSISEWTVTCGRVKALRQVLFYLEEILNMHKSSRSKSRGSYAFETTLAMSLAFQADNNLSTHSSNSNQSASSGSKAILDREHGYLTLKGTRSNISHQPKLTIVEPLNYIRNYKHRPPFGKSILFSCHRKDTIIERKVENVLENKVESEDQEGKQEQQESISWVVEVDSASANAPIPLALKKRMSEGRTYRNNDITAMKSTTKRKDRDIPISVVLPKNNPNPNLDRKIDIAEINESKKASKAITHYQLMQANFPLRCAVFLPRDKSYVPPGTGTTDLAVGSNGKSIITLSYSDDTLKYLEPDDMTSEFLSYDARSAVDVGKGFKDIHNGSVYTIDFEEDQQLLITGSNDKNLRVCNLINGHVSPALKGHNGTIRVVKFASISSSFATAAGSAGAGDFRPRIWDVNADTCLVTLKAHPDTVHALEWLDSNIVVTGCQKGFVMGHDIRSSQSTVWQYNLETSLKNERFYNTQKNNNKSALDWQINCFTPVLEHENQIAMIEDQTSFNPNQTSLAVGSASGCVSVVNAYTGKVHTCENVHEDQISSISAYRKSSTENIRIVTSSYDGTVAISKCHLSSRESTHNLKLLKRLENGHNDKVLSASIQRVAKDSVLEGIVTTGADGKVILWQIPV